MEFEPIFLGLAIALAIFMGLRLVICSLLVAASLPSNARSIVCETPQAPVFMGYVRGAVRNIVTSKNSITSPYLQILAEQIEACAPRIEGARNCTSNLAKFAKAYALRQAPGRRYGLVLSDKEYLADPKMQELTRLPPEFKDGLPSNWRAIAENKGWKYVEFTSSMVGAFPFNSHRRLVILVEGEKSDLWIMFTMPEAFRDWQPLRASWTPTFVREIRSHLPFDERMINVIGVEKHKDLSGVVRGSRIYFSELLRSWGGRQPRVHSSVTSCYECHANGMRSIVPALGTLDPRQKSTLNSMNKLMESYGKIDWSGMVVKEDLGPAFGRQSSCVQCHSGGDGRRGELNYYANFEHIRGKMIDLAHMPPTAMWDAKYKNLRTALGLMNSLSSGERADFERRISGPFSGFRIREFDPMHPVSTTLSRYRDEYRNSLEYLRKIGRLPEVQFQGAMSELAALKKSQSEVYQKLMNDYQKDLSEWLLPSSACGEL